MAARPLVFALVYPPGARVMEALRARCPDVMLSSPTDADWSARLAEADAALISARMQQRIDDVLAAAPRVRWLHNIGAGVEHLLSPGMRARQVIVTNGRGMHASTISEHVLAMMLAFARQLPTLMRSQMRQEWITNRLRGAFELEGQTLVVLGLGAIGTALARKARNLGMHVVGVTRHGRPSNVADVKCVSVGQIDTVLATADHLAICAPLTSETQGLIDARKLRVLKRGAFLYNISRGSIVDGQALLDALASGHLAGAGLDVTDPEPPPPDSPLWTHPAVILTGHSAGVTPHTEARVAELVSENLRRFVRGEELLNVVDLRREY